MIIEEINRRYIEQLRNKGYSEEKVKRMAIMYDGEIRMANLFIYPIISTAPSYF